MGRSLPPWLPAGAVARAPAPTYRTLRRQSGARALRRAGCVGALGRAARSTGGEVSDTKWGSSARPNSFAKRSRWQRHLRPGALKRKLTGLAVTACVLGRAKPRGLEQCRGRGAKHAPELVLTLRCQSATRALRRAGCLGALGSAAWSVAAKCQTNFGLISQAGQFRKRSAAKAGRARVPALPSLGAPDVSDGLASLRPAERNDSDRVACEAGRVSGVERLQSWRVRPRARAEQCHALGRRRRWATRGARAPADRATGRGSVTPGCWNPSERSESSKALTFPPRSGPRARGGWHYRAGARVGARLPERASSARVGRPSAATVAFVNR